MDSSFDELNRRFEIDVQSAIEYCESILCGDEFKTISDFISYHKSICPSNCCNHSWNKWKIAVFCKNCAKTQTSCICLQCYLNGNHQNHKTSFILADMGNCDCGDDSSWKSTGFCPKHFSPETENLSEQLSTFLCNCFAASLTNLSFLAMHKSEEFTVISQWLNKFSDINSTFKALVADAMTKTLDLSSFLVNFHVYAYSSIKAFSDLLISLLSNSSFCCFFSQSAFPVFPKVAWMLGSLAINPGIKSPPYAKLESLYRFLSYSFVETNLNVLFRLKYDWASSLSQTYETVLRFVSDKYDLRLFKGIKCELLFNWTVELLKNAENHLVSQKDSVLKFSENLFPLFLMIEGQCKFQRAFGDAEDETVQPESASLHLIFGLSNVIRKIFDCNTLNEDLLLQLLFNFYEKSFLPDEFDTNHEKSIFLRSTLSPGVCGSEMLGLHISFGHLIRNKPNKRDYLMELHQKFNSSIPFDHFLFYIVLLPIRLFCVHYQNSIQFFVRNCDSFRSALSSLTFRGNNHLRIFPLFGLIQTVLGVIEDKNFATFSILNIIGLSEYTPEDEEFGKLLFVFLFFISNIITDVISIPMNLRLYMSLILALNLKKKSALTFTEISNLYWLELQSKSYYHEVIDEVSEKFVQETETKYRLKDQSLWQPLIPYQSLPNFLNSISSFLAKDGDQLLPFPTTLADEAYEELDITGLLFTSSVYATIYCVISNYANNKRHDLPALHVSLQLLLLMKKLSTEEVGEIPETIVVSNFNELIENIPLNYHVMIQTKIQFCSRNTETILEMLIRIGKLGISVVQQIAPNSITETLQNDLTKSKTEKSLKKAAALAAKKNAIGQINNSASAFQNAIANLTENEFDCCICQDASNDHLWFPMTVYKSALANLIMKTEVTNYSAIICTHSIHINCLGEHSNLYFLCSSCRCYKNCLLPIFTNSEDYSKEIIDQFIKIFNQSIKCKPDILNTLYILISIFVGLIVTIEFRNRSNDQFASKNSQKILVKYLYNIILIIQKEYSTELTQSEKFIPFHSFILEVIKGGDYDTVLKSYDQKLINEDLQIFHEHVSMFNYLVFDHELITNNSNLRKTLNDFVFPNMFFEFLRPEYGSIPVDDYLLDIGICLFTGTLITFDITDETPKNAVLINHHMLHTCKGFCPVLLLTNRASTMVNVYTDKFNNGIQMKPFYLTSNGDANVGFSASSEPVYFREKEYQKLLDQLFSGEWIWGITGDQAEIFLAELAEIEHLQNGYRNEE